MSALWNGRAFSTGSADSLAERCGRMIDQGARKLGLKDLRSLRVDPSKCKDVFWVRNGSTKGRAGRLMKNYPDVRGLRIEQIVKKLGVTRSVAGRVLALQSMQAPTGGAK